MDQRKEDGSPDPSSLLEIGSRIDAVCKSIGSRKDAATVAGLSTDQLGRYIAGESPRLGFVPIAKLCDAAGYSLEWVWTGQGPMRPTEEPQWADAPAIDWGYGKVKDQCRNNAPQQLSDEYALVPLYDVRAAAGHGAVVEDEQVTDSLAFKRQWIHQELNANPNDLYLIYVDGESMEPTLRPGDIILVDRRSAQSVPRDGIYVLRMDGSLLVKRLQRLPGRQVKVTSDNTAYEPYTLGLDDTSDDLAIIGRVVWAGRRL